MIIDAHTHLDAPAELYAYRALLQSSQGYHGRPPFKMPEDRLREATARSVELMDEVGTDRKLVSPRPFHMIHSEHPHRIVGWWTETVNDVIAAAAALFPGRLIGVAGLPQGPGAPIDACIEELGRCVEELGFVACVINPDPAEGTFPAAPPMGDEYWYPLYEAMCRLDVPALIHPASCRNGRESYSNHFITEESIAILSLLGSRTLLDFPDLKLMVSHGGGSIPYQVGRWRAERANVNRQDSIVLHESFDESLKRLYFDTALYNKESLELLFRLVGTDRCAFGTERPGTGSGLNPETGSSFDDLRPVIESIDWLSDGQRDDIFSGTIRRLCPRLDKL